MRKEESTRGGSKGSQLPEQITLDSRLPVNSASHSQPQEEEKEQTTAVISGHQLSQLLKQSTPLMCCLKMWLESSVWYSPTVRLEWQAKPLYSKIRVAKNTLITTPSQDESSPTSSKRGMKQFGLLYQLVPYPLRIAETEYGLWREIKTTQGNIIKVSPEDYDRVIQKSWHIANGYARGCLTRTHKIMMHTFILGKPPKGMEIDHINRDKLDNRRENLRFVTKSQNSHNRKIGKGIWWEKDRQKWRAEIINQGKKIYLGIFKTEQEAKNAYIVAKNWILLGLPISTNRLQLLPTARASGAMGEDLQNIQDRLEKGDSYDSKLEQAVARVLLPTPNTMEGMNPKSKEEILAYNKRNRPGRSYATCNLRERIAYGTMSEEMAKMKQGQMMLPTPTGMDDRMRDLEKQKERHSMGLGEVAQMLPTPRAGNPGSRPNQKGGKILAEEIVKAGMLPTPVEQDYKRRGPNSQQQGLPEVLHMIPTPTRRDYKGSSNQVTTKGRNPETNSLPDALEQSPAGERTGMRLQPEFVEWMQGFPIGWTEIE